MGLLLNPKDCELISRDELSSIQPPAGTRSWRPIPHTELVGLVERLLPHHGLHVCETAYGISHDGHRFFGVLQVQGPAGEFSRVIGLRNSTDKRFSAGLCAGISVTVCSNMMFTGTIQVSRKHTSQIRAHLPHLVNESLGQLHQEWQQIGRRIDAYKSRRLTDRQVHHLVIQGLDHGVYASSRIPEILREWREPSHAEFRPRSLWSWHNAVTENLKDRIQTLPAKTTALNRVCDQLVGLN